MLRKAYLFLFICFSCLSLSATPKQLQAFFTFGIYSTQAGSPYVEVYLKIPAATLDYKPVGDNKFKASARTQLYILRNDTVVFRNRSSIGTAPITDTNSTANILDIKRFELPNGKYDLVLYINDENDTLNQAHIEMPLQVSVYQDKIQMADVLFCDTVYPVVQPDAFTRYGFNFIPSVSNIMEKSRNSLLFYNEIYNTQAVLGKGDFKYMISLRNAKGALVPGYEKIRSQKTSKLGYVYDALNISKLPGGEYFLQIAVLDKNNKPIAQRDKYFIRVTDSLVAFFNAKSQQIQGMSAQAITDFMPYMESIVSTADIEAFTKAKGKDSVAVQNWFYRFWEQEDPTDPQKAYADYVKLVTEVQKSFGTMISQGYRTDRGRIYLKYGKPDNITPYVDEPNAYPYEIWHYYKTPTRNNVKFIFYNPTQMHNDYILLHSEMPSEKQNPNWKRMIYRRIDKSKSIEDNNGSNNFGDDLENRIGE